MGNICGEPKITGFFDVKNLKEDFKEAYKLEDSKVIGTGTHSRVKKTTKKSNNEVCAVKMIDKLSLNSPERVNLKKEVNTLRSLSNLGGHPNILRFYDVFENDRNVFIVTELCNGCDLYDEI